MYENDNVVRTSRPSGLNAIELQLFICMYTRDYQAELFTNPKLNYRDYMVERFYNMFKVPNPETIKDESEKTKLIAQRKNMRLMVDSEINSCIILGFLHQKKFILTAKGNMFVIFSGNGGYGYQIPKFDNLLSIYYTILTQVGDSSTDDDDEEEAEEEEEEEIKLNAEDFVNMYNEIKREGGFWTKLKHLIVR